MYYDGLNEILLSKLAKILMGKLKCLMHIPGYILYWHVSSNWPPLNHLCKFGRFCFLTAESFG